MKNLYSGILALVFIVTGLMAQVTFETNGQQLNNLAGRGVKLADFNNDGFTDAFVVNEDGPDGDGYRVYFGQGNGQFTDSGQQLVDPNGLCSLMDLGDANGDSSLEIITGKTIWVHDNNGLFSPISNAFNGADNDKFYKSVVSDLNSDGFLDVFAIVAGDTEVKGRVYFNDGLGHFSDSGQRLGDGTQASVELGDFNNDNHIDAVITGWRNKSSDICPNRIWLNDGTGIFTQTGQVLDEGMRHIHGQALGDIDNDGDLDIVLAIQTSAPFAQVYNNDGTGQFTKGRSCGNNSAEKVKLADMDGDKYLDIVLACDGANEVWLNNANGNFTNSGVLLGSEWSWGIDIGDFNGDEKPDIFVVNMAFEYNPPKPQYFARGRYAEVWLNTTTPSSIKGKGSETKSPTRSHLLQNYPNPFNPTTAISYQLADNSNVQVRIYDVLGKEIKTLVDSYQQAGEHSIIWNGMDEVNNPVSSGVYFCSLEAENIKTHKKMLFIQ